MAAELSPHNPLRACKWLFTPHLCNYDFLMRFGLSKLSDLPGTDEIEELIGQKAEAKADPVAETDADEIETE